LIHLWHLQWQRPFRFVVKKTAKEITEEE